MRSRAARAARLARRRSTPPMPQCVRPSSVRSVGTPATPLGLRVAPDRAQPARGARGRRPPRPPRPGRARRSRGRARYLAVGRDVEPLAEERLVERVLEGPEPSLVAGPQARRERQRRAGLVARQVDLDPGGEGAAVHVLRPVGAEVVAPDLEQGLRRRAQLERQPLDLEPARVLGRLDRTGLHVRVRADHVVVEADPVHGPKYAVARQRTRRARSSHAGDDRRGTLGSPAVDEEWPPRETRVRVRPLGRRALDRAP